MLDAKTVTVANVLSSKRTQNNGETWESIRVNVTWPRELRVADDPPNTPFGVSEAAPVWDTSAKLLRLLFKATDVTKGCCACGSESVADHCCACSSTKVYATHSTDQGQTYAEPSLAFPLTGTDNTPLDWSLGGQQVTQLRSGRFVVGAHDRLQASFLAGLRSSHRRRCVTQEDMLRGIPPALPVPRAARPPVALACWIVPPRCTRTTARTLRKQSCARAWL